MRIFVCPRVWIPYTGNTVPDKLSLINEQNVTECHRMCSHGCSHSENHTQLAWSPGKGCVLFGDDADRNNNSAKFSIPVSVTVAILEILHIHVLGLHCTAIRISSSPVHHHVLRLLMGRNQSPSKFCVGSQMFLRCGILWSGYHCQYSSTTASPLPL